MRSRHRPQAVRLRDLDHYRPLLLRDEPRTPLVFATDAATPTRRAWLRRHALTIANCVFLAAVLVGALPFLTWLSGGHP